MMRALEPPKKAGGGSPTNSSSSRLFVGGIPIQATHRELVKYFSGFGPLRCITLSRSETEPTLNKGFGFVIFERAEDAQGVLTHGSHHIIRSKIVR